MTLPKLTLDAPSEVERLTRRMAEIELDLERLEEKRKETRRALETARAQANMCPKCGRAEDFLTDEGGYLAHVLEDKNDTDLLEPGKPLYCPDCGEVFLYVAPPENQASAPPKVGTPAATTDRNKPSAAKSAVKRARTA